MNIDTLSIARDLEATELPAEQAEAIAAAIGRSLNEGAASKADLDVVAHKIEAMEERLTAKLEGVKSQLLMWLAGTIFAAAGVLIAVIKES